MTDLVPSGLQIIGAGFFACVGGIAGALIRQRGPWRAQEIQADHTFQNMLLARIDKLERDQISQREHYEARLGAMDAESRADRHKMGNIEQCFNTLVLSIKRNPEHASDAADMVLSLRAKQEERETAEKAAILGAKVMAPTLSAIAAQEAQA